MQSISVRELLEKYIDACRSCPEYGRVWSCPPEVPIAEDYLKDCITAYIIMELLWAQQGLPEYNLAMAALFSG